MQINIKADDIDGGIQAAINPLSLDKGKLMLLLMKQRYAEVQFIKAAAKIMTEKIVVASVYRFQSKRVS